MKGNLDRFLSSASLVLWGPRGPRNGSRSIDVSILGAGSAVSTCRGTGGTVIKRLLFVVGLLVVLPWSGMCQTLVLPSEAASGLTHSQLVYEFEDIGGMPAPGWVGSSPVDQWLWDYSSYTGPFYSGTVNSTSLANITPNGTTGWNVNGTIVPIGGFTYVSFDGGATVMAAADFQSYGVANGLLSGSFGPGVQAAPVFNWSGSAGSNSWGFTAKLLQNDVGSIGLIVLMVLLIYGANAIAMRMFRTVR